MFGRRKYYVRGVGLRNTNIVVLQDTVGKDHTASAAGIDSGNCFISQMAWREVGKLDRAHYAGYADGLQSVKDKIRSHVEGGDELNLQDVEKFIDDELFDVDTRMQTQLPFYDIEVEDLDFHEPPPVEHRERNIEYIVLEDEETK